MNVSAYLAPEPENEKDSKAISVQIDYGKGKKHVGYIAKELSQFIHPLLRSDSITKVEIEHTKFTFKWQLKDWFLHKTFDNKAWKMGTLCCYQSNAC